MYKSNINSALYTYISTCIAVNVSIIALSWQHFAQLNVLQVTLTMQAFAITICSCSLMMTSKAAFAFSLILAQ